MRELKQSEVDQVVGGLLRYFILPGIGIPVSPGGILNVDQNAVAAGVNSIYSQRFMNDAAVDS